MPADLDAAPKAARVARAGAAHRLRRGRWTAQSEGQVARPVNRANVDGAPVESECSAIFPALSRCGLFHHLRR